MPRGHARTSRAPGPLLPLCTALGRPASRLRPARKLTVASSPLAFASPRPHPRPRSWCLLALRDGRVELRNFGFVSSHPQKAKTKRPNTEISAKSPLRLRLRYNHRQPRHSWSRRTCPRSGKPTPTRGREIRAASRHNLRRADAGCGTELPQLPARPVRGTGIQIQPKPRGGPGIWIRARRHLGVRTRPLLAESARGRRPGALRRRSLHAQRLSERAGGHSHTACRVGGAGRRGRTGRRGWRA